MKKRCPLASSSRRRSRVIIDFAVEDDVKAAVFIFHGLAAGRGQIDDAEPPVSQADTDVMAVVDIEALVIRSAVGENRVHLSQEPRIDGSALDR